MAKLYDMRGNEYTVIRWAGPPWDESVRLEDDEGHKFWANPEHFSALPPEKVDDDDEDDDTIQPEDA